MSHYHIIDEPKPRPYEYLIVNPIVILFAGMLLPLLWMPPFYGRVWMPFLWIVVNGYLLGSPTFKSELIIAIVGALLAFSLPYGVVYGLAWFGSGQYVQDSIPYIHIANQGVFFFALYLIVFKQAVPYQLHSYLKERNHV